MSGLYSSLSSLSRLSLSPSLSLTHALRLPSFVLGELRDGLATPVGAHGALPAKRDPVASQERDGDGEVGCGASPFVEGGAEPEGDDSADADGGLDVLIGDGEDGDAGEGVGGAADGWALPAA